MPYREDIDPEVLRWFTLQGALDRYREAQDAAVDTPAHHVLGGRPVKIIDMTDWPKEQRDQIHQQWMLSIGFAHGPLPADQMQAMIDDGLLDIYEESAAPLVAQLGDDWEFVAFRYEDEAGVSLRIAPARPTKQEEQ